MSTDERPDDEATFEADYDEDDDDFDEDVDDEDDEDGRRDIEEVLDASVSVTDPGAEALLTDGGIEIIGRMPWSSNGTFLVTVTDGDRRCQAIYKPERGERPLWDFPPGLWRREVAAYVLARALGWPVVPPTVVRADAELGVGSVQFFVPSRFEEHYFTFRDEPELRRPLRQVCVLDLVSNNTDRKGGHLLRATEDGRVWGIDHGLSFHAEPKLRTVMWDYAGERIDTDLLDDLARWLDDTASHELDELLTVEELMALRQRARQVLAEGVFPHDPTGRRYPWPLV